MPPVDGKKVLIVGDSLSASLSAPGQVLGAGLLGAAQVQVNAKVGRSARSFWTEGVPLVPTGFTPDVAIVVLGTNDIVVGAAADRAAMQRLRDQLVAGGAEVWAFGPPSFAAGHRLEAGEPGIVALMRDVFGDHFLDLRPLTADLVGASARTADGIHFPASSGKVAGGRMATAFLGAEGGGLPIALAVLGVAALYLLLR